MLSLKCAIRGWLAEHLGQVNRVFLLVAITALMAIATTILAFLADFLPSALGGRATETAADAVASVVFSAPRH